MKKNKKIDTIIGMIFIVTAEGKVKNLVLKN